MTVVELRQYTLHPGQRDVLIALFEDRFIESQEACAITLIGQFRDLDRPDRFVWLRGFPDMESRARSLAAFYGGPVWKAHRDAANATMIDSDNVLLLRPLRGFDFAGAGDGRIEAVIDYFDAPADVSAIPQAPGTFVTEHAVNTFPGLPVREGENVAVRFARGPAPAPLSSRYEILRLEATVRSRSRSRLR